MPQINIIDKEIKNDIMSTDIYVKILSATVSPEQMQQDIDTCFATFKIFEQNFSRFITGNELWHYNNNDQKHASKELAEILAQAEYFNRFTNGIFDIHVLKHLQTEGYVKSKKEGFVSTEHSISDTTAIDLGGIGKGFIVDKVRNFLSKKYTDFVVDAGGDMFFAGINIEEKSKWATAIETSDKILILQDMAVATSGINKRKWQVNGVTKNHLINTKTGRSIETDILSVTVVANTTIFADVLAKSLLLMGLNAGVQFAKKHKIAALFILKDNTEVTTKNLYKFLSSRTCKLRLSTSL